MRGLKTKLLLINKRGKFADAQNKIMERLEKRHKLQQVDSVDECDLIIAFVPIVSRAGTDIEAALVGIPNRSVVLVVFHHTFDINYIPSCSQKAVRNQKNVCAADFLYHEDEGLLTCLTNDEALKCISDHLSSMNPSTTPHNTAQQGRSWTGFSSWLLACCSSEEKDETPTTIDPSQKP